MNQIKIPSHWKLIKLGDYSERPEYGYTASATQKNSEYKFLRITDIQDGSVKWDNVPYCEINDGQIQKYILSSGDIVVARIGATTGKSFLINNCPKSLFASYLIRIRTKDGLLSEFLNFYFDTSTYWQQINANKGGRLKGGVNIPIIQSLIIPLPPLDEQRAIAHTLRTIQKSKETRQKELELERERKAALMEYLFTHGTGNEPRKQTEIGEIPENWEVLPLKQVINKIQYGLSVKGNSTGNYPILRMNSLANGYVNDNDLQYVNLDKNTFEKFRVNQGDLLFNRTNSYYLVGKLGLFILDGDFVFASYLIRIAVNTSFIIPFYLSAYLNAETTQKRLRILASRGVSQSNINATKLANSLISIPSLSEQQEIAHILKLCDRKIQALEKEISLIDELFHATLEELMTGRLTTTNCFQ